MQVGYLSMGVFFCKPYYILFDLWILKESVTRSGPSWFARVFPQEFVPHLFSSSLLTRPPPHPQILFPPSFLIRFSYLPLPSPTTPNFPTHSTSTSSDHAHTPSAHPSTPLPPADPSPPSPSSPPTPRSILPFPPTYHPSIPSHPTALRAYALCN